MLSAAFLGKQSPRRKFVAVLGVIMSQSIITPSFELLLIAGRAVALLLAFVLFAWGFIRWRRAAQRDTQRVFEQLDLVRSDLLIMKEVMASAAQRVDSAAQRVVHDARMTPAPTTNAGRGYEIAARLARNGAQKDELIKNCGITAHEAELLVRLHGRAANAAPATNPQNAANNVANVNRQARHTGTAPQQPTRGPQVRSRLVAIG
jgi:hypothetical protein